MHAPGLHWTIAPGVSGILPANPVTLTYTWALRRVSRERAERLQYGILGCSMSMPTPRRLRSECDGLTLRRL